VIDLWRVADPAPSGIRQMESGTIRNRIYLGDHTEFSIETAHLGTMLVRLPKSSMAAMELQPGDTVAVGWRPDRVLILGDQ
jgi:spermidine/putrescine transport system ATP-binding protein